MVRYRSLSCHIDTTVLLHSHPNILFFSTYISFFSNVIRATNTKTPTIKYFFLKIKANMKRRREVNMRDGQLLKRSVPRKRIVSQTVLLFSVFGKSDV